jgi:hypothetical protein
MAPKACPIAAAVQPHAGKGKNAKGKDVKGKGDKSKAEYKAFYESLNAEGRAAFYEGKAAARDLLDSKGKDGKGKDSKGLMPDIRGSVAAFMLEGKDGKDKDGKDKERVHPMKAMPHERSPKAATRCLWSASKSKDGKDDLIIVELGGKSKDEEDDDDSWGDWTASGYVKSKDEKDDDDDSWGDWKASGYQEPPSSSRSNPY